MKNYLFTSIILCIFILGCKEKSKTKQEPPISAVSIIKGQLQHLDTSLYQVMKIENLGGKSDTTVIKRDEIRSLAASFLSLPDIANNKYYDRYKEERLIDPDQGTLSITAFANNGDAEIQKQMLFISLSDIANGKVKSIYIDRQRTEGDYMIEEKLFWEMDDYFSIQSIMHKQNEPEKTRFIKIMWQ
jgi:hypothetical protein